MELNMQRIQGFSDILWRQLLMMCSVNCLCDTPSSNFMSMLCFCDMPMLIYLLPSNKLKKINCLCIFILDNKYITTVVSVNIP